jgi:hypothetical protein
MDDRGRMDMLARMQETLERYLDCVAERANPLWRVSAASFVTDLETMARAVADRELQGAVSELKAIPLTAVEFEVKRTGRGRVERASKAVSDLVFQLQGELLDRAL